MKTSVLKNIWRVGVVLLVNLLVIAVAFYFAGGPDAIETLSRYGSTGEEVRQIQTKLNELGYDTGGIDGTYGTKTKNAVIAFQKSQGLSADGIAGPRPWRPWGSAPLVPAGAVLTAIPMWNCWPASFPPKPGANPTRDR